NVADSMQGGIQLARAALESGAAKARLQQLISTTQALAA
ncbi:MAG: anthranilate phosphoribosyltransferase, partial [Polaromonas sp.]